MWESRVFPKLSALSIPHHGGQDLKKGTARSILDQLEEDILAWEQEIPDEPDDDGEQHDG